VNSFSCLSNEQSVELDFYRCEEFARQGCKVYATSRRVDTIADFSNKSIEKLALDVTNDESVQTALNFILDREGKIDVVVNNAGMIAPGSLFFGERKGRC
jgi:NADP-dependent 3-hydroxy acid dehydrogenase YdfG